MGIIKVVSKYVSRLANDKTLEYKNQKAKKHAYEITGEKIARAKSNHKYINGSAAYNSKLNELKEKNERQHNRIDKIIDEL